MGPQPEDAPHPPPDAPPGARAEAASQKGAGSPRPLPTSLQPPDTVFKARRLGGGAGAQQQVPGDQAPRRGRWRPAAGVPAGPLPRQVRQRPECELRGSSWLRLAPPARSCDPRPPRSNLSVSMMYQKSVPMAAARSTKLSTPASAAAPASAPRGTRIAQLAAPPPASLCWGLEPQLQTSIPPPPLAPPLRVSPAPWDPGPSAPSHLTSHFSPRPFPFQSPPSLRRNPQLLPALPCLPLPIPALLTLSSPPPRGPASRLRLQESSLARPPTGQVLGPCSLSLVFSPGSARGWAVLGGREGGFPTN